MAVTASESIETLEAALRQGTLEVAFSDGRKVRYQSVGELQSAIAYFRGQERAAAGRPGAAASIGAFYRD